MNKDKIRVADVMVMLYAHENMGLDNNSGKPVPSPKFLKKMADEMIRDLGHVNPKLAESAPEEVAKEWEKIWQDS